MDYFNFLVKIFSYFFSNPLYGYFLYSSDMINIHMLSFFQYKHQSINEIVNKAESPCLLSRPLYGKFNIFALAAPAQFFHSQNKLGYYMLPPHVRAVNIMRPEYKHTLKMLSSIIYCQKLAYYFSNAIRIPWVQRIWD